MREWSFWVNEVGGKEYKNRKMGGVYLVTKSALFEKAVRLAAIQADVKMCPNCRLDIIVYWPDKRGKNGKRVEVKKGRPDVSNVQKSVEDALQKHLIPPHAKDNLVKWSTRAQQELHDLKCGLPDNKTGGITRDGVKRFKIRALQHYLEAVKLATKGACIGNDRNNYELHTKMVRIPPGQRARIFVRIREIDIDGPEYMISEIDKNSEAYSQ
jgi:Holliday junction resolvase RusA-like endonuclease